MKPSLMDVPLGVLFKIVLQKKIQQIIKRIDKFKSIYFTRLRAGPAEGQSLINLEIAM